MFDNSSSIGCIDEVGEFSVIGVFVRLFKRTRIFNGELELLRSLLFTENVSNLIFSASGTKLFVAVPIIKSVSVINESSATDESDVVSELLL